MKPPLHHVVCDWTNLLVKMSTILFFNLPGPPVGFLLLMSDHLLKKSLLSLQLVLLPLGQPALVLLQLLDLLTELLIIIAAMVKATMHAFCMNLLTAQQN